MTRKVLVHHRLLAHILAADFAADLERAALPCVQREFAARECVRCATDHQLCAEYLCRAGKELQADDLAVGHFEAVFGPRGEGVGGEYYGCVGLVG